MKEEEATKVISKKAYEISYALCRVASRVRHPITSKLEDCAFQIIESATSLHIAGIRNSLNLAKNYIRIGSDTSMIHKANADLLLSEILKFDSALVSMESLSFAAKANLGGIFSPLPGSVPESPKASISQAVENREPVVQERHSTKDRQSAVLSFVKQSGSCRMKDLLEQFPTTSERTLRYDLQTLVEQGDLERMGEGGPGTFYKVKSRNAPLSGGAGEVPLLGGSNL